MNQTAYCTHCQMYVKVVINLLECAEHDIPVLHRKNQMSMSHHGPALLVHSCERCAQLVHTFCSTGPNGFERKYELD